MGGPLTQATNRSGLLRRLAPLLVWFCLSLYLGVWADERWIPHDEGTLAQSAERVLDGELPHRDFDEVYSGGLSVYHALSFKIFGRNLLALRWAMLAAVIFLYLPCFWYLARRMLPFGGACLLSALALSWSFPNYFGALPSWYNLILAVAGTAALARSIDTDRSRWRFLAGVCGGLSLLIKISGSYFILGALLFLAFDAQARARKEGTDEPGKASTFLFGAGALALVVVLITLAKRVPAASTMAHFVLPLAAVAWILLLQELRSGGASFMSTARVLIKAWTPFLAGVLLCVLVLLGVYASEGALDDLWRGLFVLPQRRFELVSMAPPALSELPYALPLLALLLSPLAFKKRLGTLLSLCLLLLGLALYSSAAKQPIYQGVWSAARALGPLIAVAGLVSFANSSREESVSSGRRELFLLLSMSASLALIQLPYAVPIYYCYVAPMLVLAAAALVVRDGGGTSLATIVTGLFFTTFGLLWLNTGTQDDLGWGYMKRAGVSRLEVERGGLSFHKSEVREYTQLVRALDSLPEGATIYAAPDCPEVYFLTGTRNPTATFFEIFDNQEEREAHIFAEIEAGRIRAAVLNSAPRFSEALHPAFLMRLEPQFTDWKTIGRFRVGFRP